MANEQRILDLLIELKADTAETKAIVEATKSQISDLFKRVRLLEDDRAKNEGRQQSNSDIWARAMAFITAIGSLLLWWQGRGH